MIQCEGALGSPVTQGVVAGGGGRAFQAGEQHVQRESPKSHLSVRESKLFLVRIEVGGGGKMLKFMGGGN